jgi:phosphatidylglycerophosphate synthase
MAAMDPPMIVWIDATGPGAGQRIFGLSVLERHLQGLVRAAGTPARVVIELGDEGREIALPRRLTDALAIAWRRTPGDFAARLRPWLGETSGQTVMLLDGSVLADARLHPRLAQQDHHTVVLARKETEPAAMVLLTSSGSPIDDLVDGTTTKLHDLGRRLVARGRATRLQDVDFDGFVRKLRRSLPYYLFRIDGPERVAKVERFLFWSNYKGSTDLFTRYVYPPLVWLLVRPLARWRVHPNVVTWGSIVLALGAIPCWASGYFLLGFLMAYAMSVLDSVDGKLARLTFTDSWLGNLLDHGLDMVHPPLWYAAWAYGLGLPGEEWTDSLLGEATIVVTLFYVADRVILKIYPRFFQRAFHTHSRMDGFVRSFIARRNIALPIFMVGWFADLGSEAFCLIAAWQVVTALYHGGRTFWILAVQRAHEGLHRPIDVAGGVADVG